MHTESRLIPAVLALTTLLAALLAAGAAGAQTPAAAPPAAPSPAAAAGKGGGPLAACRADVDKLCATAEKTQGWRGKCLRDNAAQLSAECKTAVANVREQREKVRAACASDIGTLCKAEAEGANARPMQCLKTNEAKLSAGCKTALNTAFADVEDQPAPAAAAKP